MIDNNVDTKIKEQISAYLDGELAAHEQDMLLRRLSTDTELQKVFERYQLIRESMSNQLPSQIDLGFSGRIHDEIAKEPVLDLSTDYDNTSTQKNWRQKILKPLTGIAVAATVVAVTVFNIGGAVKPVGGSGEQIAGQVAPALDRYNANRMRWDTRTPEVGASLNGYLVNHNEYTSSTSMQGMLQYVHIAGYDVEQK